jgi:hypothetical protein
MSNTKVALCSDCRGKRLILHRTDTPRGAPTAYYFRCCDCVRATKTAPTLKLVAELVEWVPIDAPAEVGA